MKKNNIYISHSLQWILHSMVGALCFCVLFGCQKNQIHTSGTIGLAVSMYFFSENDGLLFTTQGVITPPIVRVFRTLDGGQTWQRKDSLFNMVLAKETYYDGKYIYGMLTPTIDSIDVNTHMQYVEDSMAILFRYNVADSDWQYIECPNGTLTHIYPKDSSICYISIINDKRCRIFVDRKFSDIKIDFYPDGTIDGMVSQCWADRGDLDINNTVYIQMGDSTYTMSNPPFNEIITLGTNAFIKVVAPVKTFRIERGIWETGLTKIQTHSVLPLLPYKTCNKGDSVACATINTITSSVYIYMTSDGGRKWIHHRLPLFENDMVGVMCFQGDYLYIYDNFRLCKIAMP